jgi:hypothetical protein
MARVKRAIQKRNLLPIFNKERTELSIKLWNAAKAEREAAASPGAFEGFRG